MPALGRQAAQDQRGPAIAGFQDARARDGFARNVRDSQRMNTPTIPILILQESERKKVYIYNVGPWRIQQEMGSKGIYVIPGLEEDKVLAGPNSDYYLSVAKALFEVPGIPMEFYPGEGQSKILFEAPPEQPGEDGRTVAIHPGLNFAMEILGVGKGHGSRDDLRPQGLFVSEIPEQSKPKERSTPEEFRLYRQWEQTVLEAQRLFRQMGAEMLREANELHARSRFHEIRSDKHYQIATILGKTEVDCPWLKDTPQFSNNKACLACGTSIKMSSLKCPACGTLQMSQEAFDAEIKRRQALSA